MKFRKKKKYRNSDAKDQNPPEITEPVHVVIGNTWDVPIGLTDFHDFSTEPDYEEGHEYEQEVPEWIINCSLGLCHNNFLELFLFRRRWLFWRGGVSRVHIFSNYILVFSN